MIKTKRFSCNPIITPSLSQTIGDNINGASVINTPEWLPNRLGLYYLYFAHHKGTFIRLAYSDNIEGPWKIHESGTLHLEDAPEFRNHIASPDVHVDSENRLIRMYFHGNTNSRPGQWTGIATSKDGITFQSMQALLGKFYFRVWKYNKKWYAIAKNNSAGWGELYQARSPEGPFKLRGNFIKGMRHATITTKADELTIYYTRVGDAPERILQSKVDMKGDWMEWAPSEPIEVLKPEHCYEGVNHEIKASNHGSAIDVCELRDPFAFHAGERLILFYSGKGESNICAAYINAND